MARMLLIHQNYHRRALRRERIFRDRSNPLEMYDEVELFERYRFSRQGLTNIFRLIHDEVAHQCLRSKALTVEQQVCLALRFFASGCFQNLTGDTSGVHKSTACRAIRRVSLALARLLPQYVQFPRDAATLQQYKLDFMQTGGFPNVIGCIDCTHIRIISPSHHEWQFVNRKGYHSINVQLVCDPDLKIINCEVKWPGSTHDSRILRESDMFNQFEAAPPNGLLLGDSGYPLKGWLMTPFLRPATAAEENYNRCHKSTRSTIERCNGVIKRKFSCLKTGIRMNPARACTVTKACIVLYNLSLRRADQQEYLSDTDDDSDEESDDEDDVQRQRDIRGRIRCQDIVNNYF